MKQQYSTQTHLIQLYEASNKNNSPKENKNSPLSSLPDDSKDLTLILKKSILKFNRLINLY
jgi:hypothetical protein